MFKIIKRVLFLVLLVAGAGIGAGGCNSPENPADPIIYDHYDIYANEMTKTEYPIYKFTSSEKRKVYVGGDRGRSINPDLVKVRAIDSSRIIQGSELLYHGNNTFDTLGVYTMGLDVTAPNGVSGSYTYTFELGNEDFSRVFPTTATVELIPNRNYDIEYSCMGSSYDLRTLGYDFEPSATRAFGTASTAFRMAVENNGIPVGDFTSNTEAYLLAWGDAHARDGTQHNPNTVVLFGVKTYTTQGSEWGRTVFGPTSSSPRRSYAFVFGEKIDNSLSGEVRQVYKTRIAVHELTHARGKNENNPVWGDFYHHQAGDEEYNGVDQKVCIMRYGLTFTVNDGFKFCERHKQLLFNASW